MPDVVWGADVDVCLSVYPFIYPSIHPSIHPSIWSVQKASSNAIWKIEIFIKEDTRHKKHCTWDSDASVPFKVGTLWPYTVLPIAISCPITFSWISLMVWIASFSKVILVLGKARSHRAPNLCCRGTESPGWFDVLPKTLWDVMHEWVCFPDEAVNHQLPTNCGLLNHLNCFHRGTLKLNTNFDADPLLYSLSHFECDGHTVHMLTQWASTTPTD